MVRTIQAKGWLRTSGFGSATARFEIRFESDGAVGEVRSELAIIAEAKSAGRALLVTEAGRWISIRPTDMAGNVLRFEVLDDEATLARCFS
ncbi:hypothetical protein [Ancylobacter vacuolatus]|uniref:Uncharacterized protein n=1 Tax=Ancylobacter vacuolatus TaxID=223389 RepID=A0ABU0DDW0_9HYPH|nr:hypothetical protein [Ancylobacter vacuolatus]MDQ0346610.1 hypothetical protein [Ancylobacter vacuolatus]